MAACPLADRLRRAERERNCYECALDHIERCPHLRPIEKCPDWQLGRLVGPLRERVILMTGDDAWMNPDLLLDPGIERSCDTCVHTGKDRCLWDGNGTWGNANGCPGYWRRW